MEDVVRTEVTVEKFAEDLELEIVNRGRGKMTFSTVNVSRPGLQLAGFFDYFDTSRVQVIGNAEMGYFRLKPDGDKKMIMDMIMGANIPCLIVCRNLDIPEIMIDCAKRANVPLFRTKAVTTACINALVIYFNDILAPSMSTHGVLLDIYGVGVLLTGHSGIGKSETALELVKRGHRLVADDAVVIKKIDNELIGSSPEIIRDFMEIRGIGVINVRSIFGIQSVLATKHISLIVEMEHWDDKKTYDRLGEKPEAEVIMGVSVPKMIVPISPGRNLPIIIESAATNYRLKSLGYDSSQILVDRTFGTGDGKKHDGE